MIWIPEGKKIFVVTRRDVVLELHDHIGTVVENRRP